MSPNDSTLSSPSLPTSPSSPTLENKVVGHTILFFPGFVLNFHFQHLLEKEAWFLITLGTHAKLSMEAQPVQCRIQMETVQCCLTCVSNDLDIVIAAVRDSNTGLDIES